MSVDIRYYAGGTTETFESFLTDVNNAHEEPQRASDPDGMRALTRLWLEYFDKFLGTMPVAALIEYLQGRQCWRQYEEWVVLKTTGEPCIVYAAQNTNPNGVTLVALGACYRYPNGTEDEWWNTIILPRLRRVR
jgi:hypothetical protein